MQDNPGEPVPEKTSHWCLSCAYCTISVINFLRRRRFIIRSSNGNLLGYLRAGFLEADICVITSLIWNAVDAVSKCGQEGVTACSCLCCVKSLGLYRPIGNFLMCTAVFVGYAIYLWTGLLSLCISSFLFAYTSVMVLTFFSWKW